jgi:hypothetical protein
MTEIGNQSMAIASESPVFIEPFSHVDTEAPCWVWRGRTTKKGYGVFRAAGREIRAHRWSWAALVGDIPAGLVLDHLCRNHPCVNPDHLEPVTRAENTRRGPIPKRNASRNRCLEGHLYSTENTVIYDDKRHCRICMRKRKQEHHARRLPVLGAAHSICYLGHELTTENTVLLTDGYPVCKQCASGWALRA